MARFITLLSLAFAGSSAFAATGDAASKPSTNNEMANPTQAQVLHVLVTANKGEVEDGKVAMTKASHARVKEFAEHMVRDHSAALDKLNAMSTKNNWKPEDNAISQKLEKERQDTKAKLAAVDGMGFDRQYIEYQIKTHKDLLDLIDNKLAPNVNDSAFKAQLGEMRASVAMHLEHAQKIESEVKERGYGPSSADAEPTR